MRKANYTNNSIVIEKSPTADSRTCDFKNVTEKELLNSSISHISDVRQGLAFFQEMLTKSAGMHDEDKITDIEEFHKDFVSGFERTEWWDRHRKVNRHHLREDDGIPEDVNLVDVLDYLTDCVMAGMARSGSVYDITLDSELLQAAFTNTVSLLKERIHVQDNEKRSNRKPAHLSITIRS